MKKLLLLTAAFLFFSISHYGQFDSSHAKQIDLNLKQHFLEKSRKQLKTGLILAGSGVALDIIAMAMFPKDYDILFGTNSSKTESQANLSGILFVAGAAAIISSIPCFITSIVNKHRARVLINRERVELSPQIKTSQWQLKTGLAINF